MLTPKSKPDPDATSKAEPVKAQMCHWIVTNLTLPFQSSKVYGALDWLPSFFSAKETKENGIKEVMPYLPPTPPPKTGLHRYVFVLLEPRTEGAIRRELTKPKDRPHWGYGEVGAGVKEWADENDLSVVGKHAVIDLTLDVALMSSQEPIFSIPRTKNNELSREDSHRRKKNFTNVSAS